MEKNASKPDLFEKFIAEKSTAAELNQLFDYFGSADKQLLEDLINTSMEQESDISDITAQQNRLDAIHAKISAQLFIEPENRLIRMVRSRELAKIAATILLVISAGLLLFRFLHPPHQIVPGTSVASLSIDGKKARLGSGKDGVLYRQHGIEVITKTDGTIIYKAINADAETASRLNTLETPRGGEYSIILSDGSVVMLNAGSKLIFPTDFRGSERKVYVEGEAFFQVAKNAAQPFIVAIGGNEIKVLGTRFNVSSYPGNEGTETTLLEGSIQFSSAGNRIILKPNQQVIARNGQIQLKKVAAEDFSAWTRGTFLFNDVPLAVVMQQLARWYNVDVQAEAMPQKNLYLKLSRKADINEVLEMISKATGYRFNLEGNKIVLEE
ncbi:FecR family protein [Pedobacter psychrotolerans]|nr:FecR family protein [Pedobacter psychrotolerans]